MAGVLAMPAARSGWSRATLELLGDAAVVAKRLNGHVGCWIMGERGGAPEDGHELAAHGGDIVFRLLHPRLAHWASECVAAALAKSITASCRVLLLPGEPRGDEVAALLAERLDSTWIPDALTLSVTRTLAMEVNAVLPGGKLSRSHRPPSERLAIVTMRPGVAEARPADRGRPVEIRDLSVDLDDVPALTAVERFLPADPRTVDIAFAERIVAAGRGAGGPDGVRLVGELADDLHAALGASRMIVDLGWAPAERQVGQTGKTVSPDLYVACGISGASHHLAGMRNSKHIVAINPDAKAPLHEIAHLSLKADLHALIPAIRAVLRRRERGA